MTSCKTCSDLITAVPDSVRCDGTCGGSFHLKCVNLTRTSLKLILDHPNINFSCNDCKNPSFLSISSHLSDIKMSISKLSSELSTQSLKTAELATTADKLSDVVAANTVSTNKLAISATPTRNMLSTNISTKKRRLNDNAWNALDSSPITTRKHVIGSCNDEAVGVKAVEPRSTILVTQLHPSTTVDSIIHYVTGKLNLDPNSCEIRGNMLIPKNRKIEELDYIGCKITIPQSMYLNLMNAALWPMGVVVRDFIFMPRKPTLGHFLPPAESVVTIPMD